MEMMYLTNGQACYLKEKIGEKYIVNKIFIFEHEQFYDDDSEIVEFIDGNDIVVDVVFKTPPVPKFSSEVLELIKKKDELQQEVRQLTSEKSKLRNEVEKLTTTKITKNKFIINKTELINAKTIALFYKDRVMPTVMDSKDKSFSGLKVSIEIKIGSNEERSWGYKLYFDGVYSYGDFLCPKYGVLINPTEVDIEETIRKRILEFELSDSEIAKTDDKYLTPSLIDRKKKHIIKEEKNHKQILEKKIIELRDSLSEVNKILKEIDI